MFKIDSNLEIMFYSFKKQSRCILWSLSIDGSVFIKYNIIYNPILLVAFDKFDLNLIIVNINGLKLCQYEKKYQWINLDTYMYNLCEFDSNCKLWIFSIIKTCHNILGLSSVNGTNIVLLLYCKIIKKSNYYHNDTLTLIWLVS
jgi:hypothetical protein